MLAMILYGISIMYTPGPVSLMSMNLGLQKKFSKSVGFFIGVGVAMFVLLMIFGYTGEKLIKSEYLIYISLVGGCYIIYLAIKIYKSKIKVEHTSDDKTMTFKDGFLIATV